MLRRRSTRRKKNERRGAPHNHPSLFPRRRRRRSPDLYISLLSLGDVRKDSGPGGGAEWGVGVRDVAEEEHEKESK